MSKKLHKSHNENADGVCSNCGLEIAYLTMAGSKCAAAVKDEAEEESVGA